MAWPNHPTTSSREKHSTRYSTGMDNIAQLPVCPAAVAVGTDSKSETFAGAFAWWLLLPSVCCSLPYSPSVVVVLLSRGKSLYVFIAKQDFSVSSLLNLSVPLGETASAAGGAGWPRNSCWFMTGQDRSRQNLRLGRPQWSRASLTGERVKTAFSVIEGCGGGGRSRVVFLMQS